MKVLVIEDDELVADAIKFTWAGGDNWVSVAPTVRDAFKVIRGQDFHEYDGVVVDVNLPDGDGIDILRQVRERSDVPIVLISGSGDSDLRARTIEIGADDYVMKPFKIRELKARMERLVAVRRQLRATAIRGPSKVGQVVFDPDRQTMSSSSLEIPLTRTEFKILEALCMHINSLVSRDELYKKIFNRDYVKDDKILDVYVSRIRKKLKRIDPESASCLRTERGLGYRLVGQ